MLAGGVEGVGCRGGSLRAVAVEEPNVGIPGKVSIHFGFYHKRSGALGQVVVKTGIWWEQYKDFLLGFCCYTTVAGDMRNGVNAGAAKFYGFFNFDGAGRVVSANAGCKESTVI